MKSKSLRETNSIGQALSAAAAACRRTDQLIWRGSFDINDERSKVGRPFGDGSARQGRQIITAIRDTLLAWVKKEGTVPDEEGKPYKLRWDLGRTLEAALSFTNYVTGECIATYEMIAKAAGCCRMTAIRHMAILRRFKWIDWVRRSQAEGQAPNGYLFEISRLPFWAQLHLRQILHRKGVTLQSHPDRKGSGPVPNRGQRLAERIAKGLSSTMERITGARRRNAQMDEAAFVRAEMEHFGDIPSDRWAAIRHPDDPPAQEAYNLRIGVSFFDPASNRNAPDSGINDKEKRN